MAAERKLGLKIARKLLAKQPITLLPLSQEWHDRYEANHLARVYEFIRTGRADECDRVDAELDQVVKEAENVGGIAPKESPAERWGIDPLLFNLDCRLFSRNDDEAGEIEAAHLLITELLGGLIKRAFNGSHRCIAIIAKLAHDLTDDVEHLRREHPQIVRVLAERAPSFPILISKHKEKSGRAHIEQTLHDLNLGARAPVNQSGFDIRSTEGHPYKGALHLMCERLHVAITAVRLDPFESWYTTQPAWRLEALKLPPLSQNTTRATAEAWFVVCWKALMAATNNVPEQIEMLKDIGGYKEQKRVPPKQARQGNYSNARQAGLHERLRVAWVARYARRK